MPIEVNKCRDCGNIEPLPARRCDRCDRCLRDRLAQIERKEQQAVIVSVIPADAGWDVGFGPDGDTWITVPMEMGRPEVGQIVRFLPPTVTGIDTTDE